MGLKILRKKDSANILRKLNERFGIKEIPGTLLRIGGERLFLYQGDFSESELNELYFSVPIERIGVYFGKLIKDEIRLSIEGSQIFKNQITKNIFEMNSDLVLKWMSGQEIIMKPDVYGFIIMKHGEDFMGTGKASAEKISNFVPKNRRIKSEKIL